MFSIFRLLTSTFCAVLTRSFFFLNEIQGPSNYEPVGCYSSGKLKKAKVFGKKSYKKIKAGAERPIDQCSEGQDYAIIGIQRIKKDISCLNGNEEKWDPNDFKMEKESKCPGGAGSKKTIFIYKKSVNPGRGNYKAICVIQTFNFR